MKNFIRFVFSSVFTELYVVAIALCALRRRSGSGSCRGSGRAGGSSSGAAAHAETQQQEQWQEQQQQHGGDYHHDCHSSSSSKQDERSPIFYQFLDCLYQLQLQFPTAFEYGEPALLAVRSS